MKRWEISGAPSEAQLEEIAAILRSGGIVLMPTDTIYGLHALPSQSPTIAEIKGRDEAKRFVTIADSADRLDIHVPEVLRTIWPAPLTAILRRGESTIAVRVPDLDWLRALLEKTGPLISTSANRSGEPPILEPSMLPPALAGRLDGLVDGGRREGKASAIVDFTETEPRFIRDGEPRFTQMLRKTLMKKL
ncbi:MAG TPA: L-threonylcarbamoyladenylate synthase [Thermoanaerobaculia bacterium]|nr:L-threonylcarbamoyladenylate synthase [Thermoanaerobaculia bacterium]